MEFIYNILSKTDEKVLKVELKKIDI